MAELIGTLKVKYDTQKVSDRFMKREFVIATELNTPYPQFIPMQMTQDKCQILDLYNEGDEVRVQVNFRGREWNGPQGVKYFLTMECWRIEKTGASTAPTTTQPPQDPPPTFTSNPNNNDNDDLPF